MTKFLMIRHGQSVANENGIFAGHTDAHLTELGELQARKTAEYIKGHYKVDKIFASPLQRAKRTAEISGELLGLQTETRPELAEIFAGKWEGMRYDDIPNIYPDDHNVWVNDIGKCRPTDGESVAELYERVVGAIKKIAEEFPDSTVLIGTHATPVRAASAYALGIPAERLREVPWSSNASVTVIEVNGEDWHLAEASADAHLAELVTRLGSNT